MSNRPSKRVRLAFSLLGVLALVATSCGGSSDDTAVETSSAAEAAPEAPAETVEASEIAEPSLVAATVSGGQIDFASLEGQDVVLWFWAPW